MDALQRNARMVRRSASRAAGVLVLLLASVSPGCSDRASPVEPLPNPPLDIIFPSDRESDLDEGGAVFSVYGMYADGSGITRLHRDNDVTTVAMDWSPDGTKIVFTKAARGLNWADIYTMNADGSDVVRLTEPRGVNTAPKWSPTGTRILFTELRSEGRKLYVMEADGTNPIAIPEMHGYLSDPVWSPDGERIAVTGIFVVGADGGGPVLPSPLASGRSPAWSPDGGTIAFTGDLYDEDGQHVDVYVVGVDGSSPPIRLTTSRAVSVESRATPVWSPDGRRIAFTRTVMFPERTSFPTFDLYLHVIDADGGGERVVAGPMWTHPPVSWAPDSKRIAFATRFSILDKHDVFVADLTTGAVTNLTDSPDSDDGAPHWRPR